ncbi:LPS export ABC transporter permease LptF [uncultured Aquitalea sp.]|uniref:LPS export ABC transporter permease LptF n=1 Tax=uncultured Aquitalea sp. TaxID=540272 RepID=UPI0025D335B9|nr:LPS export ABC transporter permease LptF [uncultured Aquitalea sp.]
MVFRKSLTRELTFTALGVFVVLLAIILSTQAINLLGRAAEGQVANEAVTALIGFWALGLFPLLMILTVFVSVMVVMTRLWRDHEMAVWLSSGLALKDWVWPVMRFTIPLAVLVACISLFVAPWAEQRSQAYAEIIKRREEISAISPGVFKESASSSKVYFIEDYSGEHGAATNIFMQDMTEGKLATIFAKRGYITANQDNERVLVLEDGKRYVGEPGQADYEVGSFKRYTVLIGGSQKLVAPATNRQALPTSVLLASKDPSHKSELAWRLSMPLSCILLALLAIPLSYFNPRSGHTYNLIAALMGFFLYQNTLTLVRNWILQGKVPMASILLVHAIVLAIALFLLKYRDKPAANFSTTMKSLLRGADR